MKKYLALLLVFLVIWLAGCSNPFTPDSPKAVLELDWTNKSDESDSLSAMSKGFEPAAIDTNLKYGFQRRSSGSSISQVQASLVDENGDIMPNTTFEYQFSENPEYNIEDKTGDLVEVSFIGFGKGVLTVMATTDAETISGNFEYKVWAIGSVRTTHLEFGGSPEFDLETDKNVDQDGDVVCVENILSSPYGFFAQKHDDYIYSDFFDSFKDITGLDYSKTGVMWGGDEEPEDIAKNIFFLRTRNGGYVKLFVNGIQTTPMACQFVYEYSPTGIFE